MSEKGERPTMEHRESASTDSRSSGRTKHRVAAGTEHVEFKDCDHCTRYPNRWSRVRAFLREPAAEFFGTMMLVVFGVGGVCQVVLSASTNVSSTPKGEYFSINVGWAVGVAMGVWVSGGISGGHINPAVTIALATLRGFPWKKVPYYCFAQLMGALCGAGMIYANYYEAISAYEGGTNIRTVSKTGSLFCTYAADYMTNVGAFFSEFMTSAIMMMCILSFNDKKNGPPPPGTMPISLFILILGVGLALGINTGYAINPARDLGPRIMTAMVGYGSGVFTFRSQYWLWCPVIAPICGCLTGGFVYDMLIFTGSESVVNTPDHAARQRHLHACPAGRDKVPAGVDDV